MMHFLENSFNPITYAFYIALFATLIGYVRTVWFISIGYTLSILCMAGFLFLGYSEYLEISNSIQLLLLGIWALRLGIFLTKREFNSNYRKAVSEQTESSQNQSIWVKVCIWVGVSLLYVMMFSPAAFALQEPKVFEELYHWFVYLGLGIMALGLGVEALADKQKSIFKSKQPKQFCNIGLYSWVRCPNYLGEIMFWTGNMIVSLPFFNTWWQILLVAVGWICIVLIMMGSTKRLEKKQKQHYGTNSDFHKYIKSVPILFPWLPIYSLEKVKVYLE